MNTAVVRRLDEWLRASITNRTVRQGVVLLAASTAGNFMQYAFHAYVSRAIGPEEYGVFTSLLALYVIVSVPAGIAQTVITQYVARFRALNEMGKVSGLLSDGVKYLSLAGIVAFGAAALAGGWIAAFLNVPTVFPVLVMASVFLVTGSATAVTGTLQGLQRFYVISTTSFMGPVFRVAAGVVLVTIGWGAAGALGATTVSTLLAMLLGLVFLRDLFKFKSEKHGLTLGAVSWYSGVVLVGTLAFTVLTNIDLIVVKHFFSAEAAGYYSAAATLGKIILFFPGAVTTVMFPKSSHRFALGQSASDLARTSMWVILALCGFGALVLAHFPAVAVHILFGNAYDASINLVGLYGGTMALYALVQLLMTFYISQEEPRFVWLLAAVTALLAVVLAVFHVSLVQVIVLLAASACAVLVISEIWLGGLGLVSRSQVAAE